jgi:hypothetical protein
MGYRYTSLLEVQMYPFLALPLMGLGGQDHKLSPILSEKNFCILNKKLAKPMAWLYMYGEEKNFLPLTVFILQTAQPAESIGKIKGDFRTCGWKQTACIRILQQHQRAKHARTAKYVNRPLAELWINLENSDTQNEIQTANSTTSEDFCLTVVSFSLTAYRNKYTGKRKRGQGN